MRLVVGGTVNVALSCRGAETRLPSDVVLIAVVVCGTAVLVLGSPVVRGSVTWDRDDLLGTGPSFFISKTLPMEARSRYSGTSGGLVEGSLSS